MADIIDKVRGRIVDYDERRGEIITGVALPDGTTMNAAELIGKSKITYNGVYCFECMKVLNRKRKAG